MVYNFSLITITLLILYSITYILSKTNKIKIITHRKIWNILLLITFFIMGILGIILVLNIQYKTSIKLPSKALYWHVEAGIAMTLIAIFHIAWHLPYFKSILTK